MTAPLWMAAPPEVHSTLLSSGAGSGSLLAAADAWSSLSAEYSSVADELTALLAQVQAGAWQGPSAESFVAANTPYLAWLAQASANSATAAAQHETVAAAHAAAVAAMPTLPELATNHVVHGALVATNFFGINTIPIALNEADYVRMWIQAATTMATYQAVAGSAVAATPQTDPAPVIVKSDSQTDATTSLAQAADTTATPLDDLIAQFLQDVGITWDPTAGTIDGLPYASYTNPLTLLYWIKNLVTLVQSIEQFAELLATNPEAALTSLTPANIVAFLVAHPLVAIAIATGPLSATAAPPAASAAAAVAAVAGLIDPSVFQPIGPVLAPIEALPVSPAAATAPATVATIPAPPAVPAASTTPAPSAATATAPSPPGSPPVGVHGFGFPYMVAVGGDPSIGFDSGASTRVGASTKLRAPAQAAAVAAAAGRRRARKRRRAELHEYGDAFMDIDVDPDWDAPPERPVTSTVASDQGAGSLGFAGTLTHGREPATGLATLPGDEFGGGPTLPMLPNTWSPETSLGERKDGP